MYEVIVLGATFAAAGICHRYKEKCLVIERRAQAGYEFFGALHFGSGYDEEIKSREAQRLQKQFLQKNAGVYGCDAHIYPILGEAHVLFGTEVVSVEKADGGFLCVTHGVEGFRTYKAKRIIDTRCNAEMCICKTYNLLMESKEKPAYSNVYCERAGGENRYVLRCPVPLYCGYVEARRIAQNVIRCFSETQRLILSANEFDYQVKEGYPKTQGEILYLPSKVYENPVLAFEAGLCIGEGEVNDISF